MKRTHFYFLLLLTFSRFSIVAAQSISKQAVQLDSLFQSIYNTGQFSGNVLIAENGQIIYTRYFGMADELNKIQNSAGTRFLLGSVSKQFTAMGIVLLKVAGKLNYDDTIGHYFPELPYHHITIRQLLNHTSGLPDYSPLMQRVWDTRKYASIHDMINFLIKHEPPVFFNPGERYLYSNTGYALLAAIIEKASGEDFQTYMEENVFQPIGMKNTIIYTRRYRPRPVTDYALGYIYSDSTHQFDLPENHPVWKNALWEDGITGVDGVNSTVGDMLLWDQTVFKGTFIPKKEWEEILSPGKTLIGSSDYGFGWRIIKIDSIGKIACHTGGWPGYLAYNEQHLDHNRTIIILRNKFTPQTRMPIDAIRKILQ